MARLTDNTAAVLAGLQRDIDRRVQAAAAVLAAEHKKDLSTSHPPSSRPTQYPRLRTGNLRDSVTAVKVAGGHWRVGYLPQARYILPLVRSGRLHVADTYRRVEGRIRRVIEGR